LFGDYRSIGNEGLLIIASTIMPSIATGMFFTDLAYFLTNVQGFSDLFMGSIIMVMGISMVALSLPLGMVSDYFGRKGMLMLSNAIASISIMLFAIIVDQSALIGAAILMGVSEAGWSASGSAFLADKVSDSSRTPAFSLMSFVGGLAFGIGSFTIPAVIVFEGLGYSNKDAHIILYIAIGMLSLISTLILLKVKEERTKKKRSVKELLPRRSKGVLIKYVSAGFLIAFGAGMVVPLMTRWFNLAYGITDAISGPIIGISDLLIGLACLTAPALARRMGLIKAIVVTQGISTLFMFLTPLSSTYIIASVVYTIRAFLMNMANPLQQSMIMGLVEKEERGAASGISSALWRLPNAFSTSIGAWLMGLGLLAMPFFLATVLYVVSILIFWAFFRNVAFPEEKRDINRNGG